jgi:hypothetical protein
MSSLSTPRLSIDRDTVEAAGCKQWRLEDEEERALGRGEGGVVYKDVRKNDD